MSLSVGFMGIYICFFAIIEVGNNSASTIYFICFDAICNVCVGVLSYMWDSFDGASNLLVN
ncbi:MAG: hypothetical protein COA42_22155 [Alteromonadaceae bacterium]|nr:MAG: hypothetical protein COA42_22155 [Alteromonadaceae bacterium]